ncbi:ComF family protein [Anaerobranca gottschalkii]|uniref:Competence protein ComFC n=1 Tax=Anaerobranca gottschalkii DSM 13577 TaxID=1120990 RepID=A0A1H9ZI52_9FIRM|nr:phosphoribosyltransferase family protein [Anaerobranca gottschalkii]SES81173.1 competence protein ComFC [Anaerobranca gottschalkii DSM 13577]
MEILYAISTFIFPDIVKCISCGKRVKNTLPICLDCEKDITYYKDYNTCKNCGGFYHGPYCNKSLKIMAVALYEGNWKELIHRFKFNNHQYLKKGFTKAMLDRLKKDYLPEEFDIVTYIPASKKVLKARGFDQSYLLANELAKLMERPLVKTLTKRGKRPPQHTLDLVKRSQDWEGEFILNPKLKLQGKRILLIDDISTTGNTLLHASKELEKTRCSEIIALVLAN